MEIILSTKDLSKALTTLGKLSSKRSNLPILDNVLITADKDNALVELRATDFDTAIICRLEATTTESGTITFNCNALAKLCKASPALQITLRDTKAELGEQSFELQGVLPAKDFPPAPAQKVVYTCELDAKQLRQALMLTLPCASTDPSKYVLQGIYLDTKEGCLVGCNGHTLAQCVLPLSPSTEVDGRIMHSSGSKLLLAMLAKETEPVQITLTKNYAIFQLTYTRQTIMVRCMERNYPNYKQVMSKDNGPMIEFNREQTLQTIKMVRAALPDVKMNNKNSYLWSVKLAFPSPTECTLNGLKVGLASPTKCTTATCLRADYLEQSFALLDTPTLTMKYESELYPAVIAAPEHGYTFVMMPLRIS